MRAGPGIALAFGILLSGNGSAAPLFERDWKLDIAPGAEGYAIARAPAPVPPPSNEVPIRVELRPGDCTRTNRINDCATYRERAELRGLFEAQADDELWYGFDLLIPVDYPEMSPAQILGQFHDGEAPVLSNRYENGRMTLVVQTRSGAVAAKATLEPDAIQKGRWVRLLYHVRWSRAGDGRIAVFANGASVFTHVGPNMTAADRGGIYLKLGVYRSHLDRFRGRRTPVQVAYYADIRQGPSRADAE